MILAAEKLEALVVLDAGQMAGILSLQDFARAAGLIGLSAMTAPVGDLMTPCHCVISPDDSAQACWRLMLENDVHFIPVQEAGNLVGLLSRNALLSGMVSNYEKVFRESALDQQILFLRGTYSC